MDRIAGPGRPGRIPVGLLATLILVGVVETFVARHPLHFSDVPRLRRQFSAWAAAREAPGRDVLLLGDSMVQLGLVPEVMTLTVGVNRHKVTKRVTTLGRSRDCDVVVPDPNASRVHAEIRHVGLDYYLVDMGSTNGTEVNGQVVKRHALAGGDTIVMGTTEIHVELA